jgi:hypothetical protein
MHAHGQLGIAVMISSMALFQAIAMLGLVIYFKRRLPPAEKYSILLCCALSPTIYTRKLCFDRPILHTNP